MSLVVGVADLLRRPGSRKEIHREAEVPGLAVSDSRVPEGEVAVLDAVLESLNEGVMATGTASAPWQGTCRRCLTEVDGRVEVRFQELFQRHHTDGETYPLRGEQIDLEPLLREALLLELPLAPLCAEACLGLCPECGVDRNRDECGCEVEVRDPRWAALDQLRGE